MNDQADNKTAAGVDSGYLGEMTDDEIALYNYVYATQGREQAGEYLRYITGELNRRQRESNERTAREFAAYSPAVASAVSVLNAPGAGLSYIGQAADYLTRGEIDQNAGYNRSAYMNSALRDQVTQTIEKSGKWGKAGSFLYQTGMSMGDFLISAAASGGSEALSLAIMGTGAAANSVIEAKDRGLSDGKAFFLGTIAGAAEILTEKVSLEKLLDRTSMDRSALGYFLKNVLAEGSEEGASDIINWVADVLVAQDKSQWRQDIAAYKAQGMSDKQAFVQAMKAKAGEIGLDVLGGALSGGVMAAPGAVGAAIGNRRAGAQINAGGDGQVQLTLERGLAMGPDSESYKLARKLQQQIAEGTAPSNAQIGSLERLTARETAQAREAAGDTNENAATAVREDGQAAMTEQAVEQKKKNPLVTTPNTGNTTGPGENVRNAPPSGPSDSNISRSDGDVNSEIPPAPMTVEERLAELDAREQAVNDRAGELMARGNVTEDERAELDREYRAIQAERESLNREDNEEFARTRRELTVLPTGEEIQERQRKINNLNELERSGRESGATEEQIESARRIANATGRRIVFVNNAESGRRGMYQSGTIYVNTAYGDATQQIIAHELTHSIEDAGDYEEFSRVVQRRIMETGGDLDGMLRDVRERYAADGVELDTEHGDDMKEVVAEYVERELLTNEETITSLVTENRSLGQRILGLLDKLLAKLKNKAARERDFIRTARDLYADALRNTRGRTDSEAALQQLREAYAAGEITDEEFDRAFDALGIGVEEEGEAKYSIISQPDGRKYVDIDIEQERFKGLSVQEMQTEAKKVILEKFKNKVIGDGYRAYVNKRGAEHYAYPANRRMDNTQKQDKMQASTELDHLMEAATFRENVHDDGRHPNATGGIDKLDVRFRVNGRMYDAEISVLVTDRGNLFYDLTKFRDITGREIGQAQRAAETSDNASISKVSQSDGNVKAQFSIADGTRTEAEGQEAQEDADVRDTIPAKARGHLERAERGMVNKVAELMQVPRFAKREYLQDIARDMSREYLTEGRVSQETRDKLFETAWSQGIEEDRDFYDTYKELKNKLRNQPITIASQDKADVMGFDSFEQFRQRAFGTLRIVSDGGLPVDVAYQELSGTYPELFPEDIMHPGDQILRMYEVGRSIEISRKSLDEAYGPQAKEAKAWARNDFDAVVGDAIAELRQVKRYADERAAQEETAQTLTLEEVKELYPKARDARKNYEKVSAKNLLTEEDQRQVGRLMRGDIEIADLKPERDNVRGITAVYEAKQEYEKYARQIRQWNEARRAQLRQEADGYLRTANGWKDKSRGILYSRETMERNIRDIVPDKALADKIVDTYFKPVHQAAAESTKLKNRMRDRVRALDISRKVAQGNAVSEAHAVQLMGEALDNIDYLQKARGVKDRDGKTLADWRGVVQELHEKNPNMDWDKIQRSVEEFRRIYDELFELMNDSRVRNGYEPVPYRKGYFPHFQPGDGDGIIAQFGKALGISTEVVALPTTINGLTHTFRPGIQYFGNALERTGFNTCYDAVEGFDKYIEGVADVIYQTENIQKLRALASQARYRTGDEGLRRQIDEVQADESLSEQDKQNRIDKINETGRFTLSNFVVELEEYTNLLANKKSRADRNMEQAMGRDMYKLVKALEGRVAANMVAVNPGSWLTNFIPLTQGGAMLDRFTLLHGIWDTLKAYKTDDGIVGMSTFLTNRRGSDPLVRTWQQSASAKLSSPMEWIDNFTSEALVRARYRQNVQNRQMSEAEAMEEADSWVAGVMADRSKGSTPTLFNRANPLTKMFTQFQLEVNNQLSYVFKDIPRGMKEKGLGALALALFKFALGAWLYDEVYEYVVGRRAALDPIGMLNDTVGDLTGWELPNLVSLGAGALGIGDMPSFETDRTGFGGAMENLAGNVAEELPFIGGVLGGGRVPISSALPDAANLWNAATNQTGRKRWNTIVKEVSNPLTYLILPFGGGQMKKIIQGVSAVMKGGSYTVDSQGRDIMQYPIYSDSGLEEGWNMVRASTFGKSSFTGAQRWVDSGFKNYSAKATGAYQGLTQAGVKGKDADNLVIALTGAEKSGGKSVKEVQIDLLRSSSIPEDIKIIPYYALMASDSEVTLIDKLAGHGDAGELLNVLMEYAEAGRLKEGSADAKKKAVFTSTLTDDDKITVIDELEPSTSYTSFKMETAKKYGISMEDYYRGVLAAADINGDDKVTQEDIVAAIKELDISREQKAVLYQLADSGWKPTNNPFGKAVGQEVYDAVQAEKERRETASEEGDGAAKPKEGARWENGRLVLPKW